MAARVDVSGDRISLKELRAVATETPHIGHSTFFDADVLALVEAVEAADRYANLELRACGDDPCCGSVECGLVLALARFKDYENGAA